MKTTKRDVVEFEKYFKKYAKRLGVTNWEVRFNLEKSDTNDASISINESARQAVVNLATELTREGIRDIDFLGAHEAVELFLGIARDRALGRFATEGEINGAFHSVVQGVLKLLGKEKII